MHADIELLASGYGLVEGPRVDAQDRLYFSDVLGGGVYRRSPDGAIEIIVPKRRGVGGIALHAEGGIVCSGRNLCHVLDGKTRVVYGPSDVPGWNDLYIDAAGRVYAGSMRTSPFGESTGPRTPGELWRIDGEGEAALLYGDISLSNGIGFSPDGRRLYHADTARGQIVCHDVDASGHVSNRRVYAHVEGGGPDGLGVDADGCVWVAVYGGGCVARFDPSGRLERRIEVPADDVTSMCFGGADLRDLYVVTGGHRDDPSLRGCVFRTRAPVAGLPAPLARV